MRLALAQINPTIGDLGGNSGLISGALGHAREAGADLVVLPELAICGYPPRDLLLDEGFVQACMDAACSVGRSGSAGLTCAIGSPRLHEDGRIGNSLVVCRDGELVGWYDKRLLPTYDVFDEDRYFTAGDRPMVVEVGGVRVGLCLCEDTWRGEDAGEGGRYRDQADPVAECVAAGAAVVVSASASPFVVGKGARHRRLLRDHAMRHGVHVADVNQTGANDDVIFEGHSAVFAPDGGLIAAAPGFSEHLLVAEINTGSGSGRSAVADPMPVDEREAIFAALRLGIRDYVLKTGFSRVLVGLSGGIDSALTAAVAVAALGSDAVTGVSMPSRYTSDHAKSDAQALAERLRIRCPEAPIGAPLDGFGRTLDPLFETLGFDPLGGPTPDLTLENLQSRIRGTMMMALSNRSGALLLSTGNKSEAAVGYSTLYGDLNGALAVLADLTKTRVYALSRWINEHHAACGFAAPPIPQNTIDKPPSAELRPDQKDEDSLPRYELLDGIIERLIEQRRSPESVKRELGDVDGAEVDRVMGMIRANEYKRRQMPITLKLTPVAFGPGRRRPVACRRTDAAEDARR